MMFVFSLNKGPVVIKKLASLPSSRLPTLSYTPNHVAGVFVKASKALLSLNPYSIALRRFVQNCFTSRKSADVKANGIFAFSNAAGLVGDSSQFLRSAREIYFASLGSSTSCGCGKLSDKIKGAF